MVELTFRVPFTLLIFPTYLFYHALINYVVHSKLELKFASQKNPHILCRNPTLAKCAGEAQHLEKVRIWSPSGLSNVQSSTARPKKPRIEVFLVSLERS
jgi:hypothetical protein